MKNMVLALILSAFPMALGASTYTYPQGTTYTYGNKPATPVTGTWAGDYTNLLNKYNAWKAIHLVGGGGTTQRIQRDGVDSFDTVSEGISYGMILAVYFDDKTAFDNLWAYKQSKNDGLGLMNWKVNSGGGVVGTNSAADADEDIAYSLYLAYRQWGGGYKALADAEVLKLKSYDIDGSFKVKPGDSFNSCRYPSYFFPNEYRVFGKETNDAYTWDQVRNNVYATIAVARNAATGLVAEQCTDTGTGGGCGVSSSQYQYNSCRVPFRMALDYVYYGDANALSELTKLNTVWPTGNPNGMVDCYNLNGSTCSGFATSAFNGPAATGFMVPGEASDLQSYYADLMGRNESNNYFAGAIQLMTLLLLQGNMPNIADPSAIYTPTPTRTRTPFAGSPTATFTATPVTFGYIFEDFELGTLNSYYNYAGTSSGVTGTTSNTQTNGGSLFSNKVNLTIGAAQYGGYGFNSNYANGMGIMDMTGTTVARFWIYYTGPAASISMNMSIHEGNAVGGGDNQQWKSPNITVFSMAGWQQITTPAFSLWTHDLSCGGGCNLAGNATLDLGSVRTVQFSFNAPQAATTLYIDDVAFVPLVAPSPTSTKTPFNNPYNQIFDDFENPMSLSTTSVPKRADVFADAPNGASASWSLDTVTVASGLKSAKLTYNSGTGASYGAGGYLISPYSTPGLYVDATGAVSLALWMNGVAGLQYRLEIQEAGTSVSPVAGADGETWRSNQLVFPGGGWQWVVVDLATFSEGIYNPACQPNCLTLGNNTMNLAAISSVTLNLNGAQGSGVVNIDDVNFITTFKTDTPTVSPSPSYTPTKTPTVATTFTNSPTASPTRTPTASPSPSPTASPTRTPTSSPSNSPTSSPTRTMSYTSTYTGTPSNSPSSTATPSNSPNYSPTATPTFTLFAGSPTFSPTISPTPSRTITATNSPVNTFTNTPLPTATNTPLNTATSTPVNTLTNTPGVPPTNTYSPTSTFSYTVSKTNTPGAPPTNTNSPTPSYTPTVTPTLSPVCACTATYTVSNTPGLPPPSPTLTITAVFTNSPVNSATPTFTRTLSYTATNTPAAGTPYVTSTMVSTPTGAINTIFENFENGSVPGPYTFTDGVSTISSPVITTAKFSDGANSGYVYVNTAGGTWGAGGGISTSNGAGSPSVMNVAGSQYFSFDILTDQDIQFNVFLGEGVRTYPDPQNETFNSPLVSLAASASWQTVTLPLYLFTENLGNAECAPNCASAGNGAMDLSAMLQAGLIFNKLPQTTGANVYVDRLMFTKPLNTMTPTPTPTNPAGGITPSEDGPIIKVLPVPNPGVPTSVSVLLDRRVDKVTLKLYTKSMMVTDQAQTGAAGPGWVSVPVPPAFVANAAAGNYYFVVEVEKNGTPTRKHGIGDMFILK